MHPSRTTLWLGAVVLVSGCATVQRENFARDRAAEISYAKPVAEVWPEVVALLSEKGFHSKQDPDSFTLETEWKVWNPSSRMTAQYAKYVAIARTLPNQRVIVRFYRNTKSAEGVEQTAQRNVDWGVSRTLGGGGGAAEATADGAPTPASAIVQQDDEGRSSVRIGVANSFEQRDLDLEWELLSRIDPASAAQIRRMADSRFSLLSATDLAAPRPGNERVERTAAQTSSGSETAEADTAEIAAGDCGERIPGLDARLAPGTILLLGEQPHGTAEIPRFVGVTACQSALAGNRVEVGLELPFAEQALVDRYLESEGTPEDQERLMDGRVWDRPYQDGRTSRAMLELIETVRGLKQRGLPLEVFFFDEPSQGFDARDARMAQHVLDRVAAHPESVFVVLTGNVHARQTEGAPWASDFRPMGYWLRQRYGQVTALDAAFADGTSWVCTFTPHVECGVRITRGRYNGASPFVNVFDGPSRAGFAGFYYVGPVTASPPAVQNGPAGAPSASVGPRAN